MDSETSTYQAVAGKESDSQLGDRPDSPSPHKHTKIPSLWPIWIIAGELALLALAFGFLGAVRLRGQIPLSPGVGAVVLANPRSNTYISTLIANIISIFSSFLFAQAVRHAIVAALTHPISVSQLGYGLTIAKKSPILVKREYRWGLASLAIVGLTVVQTSSWNSLLTPTSIEFSVPIQGREFDLSSQTFEDQFTQLWNTSRQVKDTVFYSLKDYLDGPLQAIIDQSGAASASDRAGYPAFVNYAAWVHEISTLGILPIDYQAAVNFSDQPSSQFSVFYTKPIPPTSSLPILLTEQQGVSAQVECETATLDEDTTPPVFRNAEPLGDYTSWNISSVCDDGSITWSQAISSNNYTLFLLWCRDVDNFGNSKYSVIIDGQNYYNGTYTCTITPKIQNMISNYTLDLSLIGTTPNDSVAWADLKDAGAIGYAGVYAVQAAFSYGQTSLRNGVGDTLQAVLLDQATDQPVPVLRLLEAYIRGIIEFTATAIKSDILDILQSDAPAAMITNVTGYALVNTVGWQYNSKAVVLYFFPIVLFALVTLGITIWAQLRLHRGPGVRVDHAHFDPTDALGLMAAAAAGGMSEVFYGFNKDDIKKGLEDAPMVKLDKVSSDHEREGLVRVPAGSTK